MGFFSSVEDQVESGRVSHKQRAAARDALWGLAHGRDVSDAEAALLAKAFPEDGGRSYVETLRKRIQAAEERPETAEDKRQLAEAQQRMEAARQAAIEAERVAQQRAADFQREQTTFVQVRSFISNRQADARNYLAQTADDAIHEEIAEAQQPLKELQRQMQKLNVSAADLQQAADALAPLERRLEQLAGSADPNAATERAFVKAQLGASKQRLKDLQAREKQRQKLADQAANIEADVNQIMERRLDPKRMKIDFGDRRPVTATYH